MQVPGKNVLILAAICVSILGGVGAYKIAQAARLNLEKNTAGIIVSAETTPTVKSENKLLNALQQADFSAISSSTYSNPFAPAESDTMTERLSKDFFVSYAKTQTGELTDANDIELVNNALAGIDTSKLPREKYSTSDMRIISGNTQAELRKYGNDFVTFQNERLLAIKENPTKYQNDLNAIGGVYASIAEKLITMQVPVSLAAEHLTIANAFYLSSKDFEMISQQTNDPVKALLGLRQYKESVERQQRMFTDIASYFKRNGIIFSDTEPGYFWNSFVAPSSAQ